VDTISSTSAPGLKAQLRGKPTLARYNYATVFVDHFSGLEYVHLHESNDGDSIIEGKLAFERYSHGFDVKIRHYHCDNGIFADNKFRVACKAAGQTISFCGVNAHHQSGKAEKRIRDLHDSARSMILLAKHNWPAAITAHLWPFAMVCASHIRASTLQEGERRTPCRSSWTLWTFQTPVSFTLSVVQYTIWIRICRVETLRKINGVIVQGLETLLESQGNMHLRSPWF